MAISSSLKVCRRIHLTHHRIFHQLCITPSVATLCTVALCSMEERLWPLCGEGRIGVAHGLRVLTAAATATAGRRKTKWPSQSSMTRPLEAPSSPFTHFSLLLRGFSGKRVCKQQYAETAPSHGKQSCKALRAIDLQSIEKKQNKFLIIIVQHL